MSNPAKPLRTATLVTPAMQTPHESLLVNPKRGLMAAVMGNPVFAPGVVDIYDLNEDCRRPVLQSSSPVGLLGHESGWAPDGRTFYATSISSGTVTALDVTNPKLPTILGLFPYPSHGLTVSDDGNRGYVAGVGGLQILDLSEVQARRPNPQAPEISSLTWKNRTIPQVAIPVTIAGKAMLVEVDEFSGPTSGSLGVASNGPEVGAARIIDISDERAPKVISNLRLEVHQAENRAQLAGDPGARFQAQGYAAHYCSVPTQVDPGIVACSFIASGLRVFDIRDPYAPKELAYFVAPPGNMAGTPLPLERSNYAMSKPAFNVERGEIWYSDGNSGFYAVRMAKGTWPFAAGSPAPATPAPARSCTDSAGLSSVSAAPAEGGGVRIAFKRLRDLPVRVDIFRVSAAGQVVRERLVARFAKRHRTFTWSGAANRGSYRVGDGFYFVRFTMLRGGRPVDVRRAVLQRSNGRFTERPGHYRRDTCGLLTRFKLERPVFGGARKAPLAATYRLSGPARVAVTIRRAGRIVRRLGFAKRGAGRTYAVTLPARGLPRGDYRVRIEAIAGKRRAVATLTARRL